MDVFIRRPARATRHCAACVLLAVSAAAAVSPAWGQLRPPDTAHVPDTSTQAYKRADSKMMDAMEGARYTGDADRDFVSHMAPHHQGAIDMAQVELKYGKDPTLRQLATRIVAAQRDEIALMERWQKEHGAKP
ncbi:CopM family metallochaperone [Burkholderia sp. AW49-1]